jgi:hypothetical protein
MTVYQWVCVLGIPGMLAGLVTFIKLQVHQNRAMKLAVQAILRDRLLQSFQFCKRQGFATSDDRQNFENMYVQYHALGGNGVMDDIRQKFFSLPLG